MIRRIALLTAGMLLVSGLAFAQASATGTATADILASITISQNRGLDFGIIAPASTGDTVVTIDATTGARVLTSGSGVLITGGGETSGEFLVEAANTYAYTVDIPIPNITIDDGAGPGVPMAVALTLSGTTGTGAGVGTATSFYVGGALTVPAGQAAGTFTGNYTVTAIYN